MDGERAHVRRGRARSRGARSWGDRRLPSRESARAPTRVRCLRGSLDPLRSRWIAHSPRRGAGALHPGDVRDHRARTADGRDGGAPGRTGGGPAPHSVGRHPLARRARAPGPSPLRNRLSLRLEGGSRAGAGSLPGAHRPRRRPARRQCSGLRRRAPCLTSGHRRGRWHAPPRLRLRPRSSRESRERAPGPGPTGTATSPRPSRPGNGCWWRPTATACAPW